MGMDNPITEQDHEERIDDGTIYVPPIAAIVLTREAIARVLPFLKRRDKAAPEPEQVPDAPCLLCTSS